MSDIDFEIIEARLIGLLDALAGVFTTDERRGVEEFLEVGEYGLALETLTAVIVEDGKKISKRLLATIESVANEMGIRDSIMSEELIKAVE